MKLIKNKVGHNIACIRGSQRLTQQELANKAGLTNITINRIETGCNANLDTIFKIAKVLKVDARELFG